MPYHLIATLPGGRKKSLYNKAEEQILAAVFQFVASGTISANWGTQLQTYQVLELRAYETKDAWHKASGGTLEEFIKGKRNVYSSFDKKARAALGTQTHRVFIVMPIQGAKYGSQDDQRIHKEYDQRFETLEKALAPFSCVAIRIDKEHALEDLVGRIKEEIRKATFVVADLTDERPSRYFEAGFAEAAGKKVIYIASSDSVIDPKKKTKVHFDIHMNVNFFTNHTELREKLKAAVEKNRDQLFIQESKAGGAALAA